MQVWCHVPIIHTDEYLIDHYLQQLIIRAQSLYIPGLRLLLWGRPAVPAKDKAPVGEWDKLFCGFI